MATTALAVAWTCLVVRTALVADNLCDRHGYGSVLRRMAACWRRLRQRETFPKSSNTAGYSGASRFRVLHLHLFLAHLTACISVGASLWRGVFKMTDTSCFVTSRMFIYAVILHQGFVVLFLEAKTEVTNSGAAGPAKIPCWQIAVKWFARFWGYIYQPVSGGLFVSNVTDGLKAGKATEANRQICREVSHIPGHHSSALMSPTNECRSGAEDLTREDNVRMMWRYLAAQFVLVALLVLLLAIFILPLVSKSWREASMTITYRRVVVRNSVCAAAIALIIVGRCILLPLTIFSYDPEQVAMIQEIASAWTLTLVLVVTEITIAIGFTSCVLTWKDESKSNSETVQSDQHEPHHEAGEQTSTLEPFEQQSWTSFRRHEDSMGAPRIAPASESPAVGSLER